MNVLKKFTAAVLSIAVILPLCSCGGGKERIYMSVEQMPRTLDAQTAESDSELLVARNIYEGLTRQDKDGKIVLAAAKEYDFSNNTYTFTLRDNLKWSSGEPIVADDFVFGIKRALLPETKAPFARLLYSVKGAKEVNTGIASADAVSVSAPDSKTVKIELTYDDKNFLETLSRPVSMPCSEEFFRESTGKYGLGRDYVLSCGTYRLARWNMAENGIRLYVNEEYTGAFKPKNNGVFIAKDKEKTVLEKLTSGQSDIAILPSKYLSDIPSKSVKTASVQNICWVLSLGGELTGNIRQALCMCASASGYGENLPRGFTPAKSIFPEVLGVSDSENRFIYTYNAVTARTLIAEEIKNFKNKKFPQTTLVYSDSEPMRPVITEIVGDWQKDLSTFINIKSTDKSLESELKSHALSLCVFPVKAESTLAEYLCKFGVSYSGNPADYVKPAGEYNLLPIAFEDTAFGYLKNISGVYINPFGGYMDFSYVTKK